VVAIAEHANIKVFTQRLRHVVWNSFFHITIELGPIIGGEGREVNVGICWVEDKARVMFLLEVPHRVEGSLKVAFTGVGKMRRKERYFGHDVDAAELNHPTGHTNEVLVE
jgi:hypothetical protein